MLGNRLGIEIGRSAYYQSLFWVTLVFESN